MRRRDHLRAVLSSSQGGGFIAEGDDPLTGLSPVQIEQFMAKAGIDPRDPLEVRADCIGRGLMQRAVKRAVKQGSTGIDGSCAAGDAGVSVVGIGSR